MDQVKKVSGFPAGTLVHTDKGLVPIEQIKVGDMVLSRHESGEGELTYKRVNQTFKRESQPVKAIIINAFNSETSQEIEEIIVTSYGHPFWTKSSYDDNFYWMPAKEIGEGYLFQNKENISNANITIYTMEGSLPLIKVKDYESVAWCMMKPETSEGILIDLNIHQQGKLEVPDYINDIGLILNLDDGTGYSRTDKYLCSVYNIEVEDYHTYFVGEQGLWVHNSSML